MQELLPPLDAQVEKLLARIDALKDEVKFAEAELFAFRRAQTQTKGHPAKAETDIWWHWSFERRFDTIF